MRVTQKDVAKAAQVSVNTVSRALRNCDDISPARRAEIKRLAEEMGYEPDPALSALAAYRQHRRVRSDFAKIAVLSYWKDPDHWRNSPAARAFLEGAAKQARAHGFELEFFALGKIGMNAKRASQVLSYRGVQGILIPPLPIDARRFRLNLDWDKFSVVTLERTDSLPNFLYVGPNYYEAMALVWRELKARGYRRPGLLLNEHNAGRSHHQWEAAMLHEQQRHHHRIDDKAILIHSATTTAASFRTMVTEWLATVAPDVVITRTDMLAPFVAERKIRIPQDLGFVSLNVADERSQDFRATGIDQLRYAMGEAAVDLVNSLLLRSQRGPEPLVRGMVIDGVWSEGDTLRPRLPANSKQ